MQRFLIVILFLLCGNGFSQDSTSWFPTISLRYGQQHTLTAPDFNDVYNNPKAFPRPFISSDRVWDDFTMFEPGYSFAAEFALSINRRYNIGVSIQYLSNKQTDKLQYRGYLGRDNAGLPILLDTREKHKFEETVIPFLFFAEYRFFEKAMFNLVAGAGVGFANMSLKWDWSIIATRLNDNTIEGIKDNIQFLNHTEKVLIYQPRLRLEFNIQKFDPHFSKYVESFYLQFDYISGSTSIDAYEGFRGELLSNHKEEELPAEAQKLFRKYDFDVGGLQIMAGLVLKSF